MGVGGGGEERPGVASPAVGWFPLEHGFVDFVATVGPSAAVVYATLRSYAGTAGVCWPSTATVAARLGLNRKTVVQALGQLIDLGVVVREARPGRSTLLRVLPVAAAAPGPKNGSARKAGRPAERTSTRPENRVEGWPEKRATNKNQRSRANVSERDGADDGGTGEGAVPMPDALALTERFAADARRIAACGDPPGLWAAFRRHAALKGRRLPAVSWVDAEGRSLAWEDWCANHDAFNRCPCLRTRAGTKRVAGSSSAARPPRREPEVAPERPRAPGAAEADAVPLGSLLANLAAAAGLGR